MAEPRFFVPDANADQRIVPLPRDEAIHLTRVLRLRPDARVRVFDGRGSEWTARVVTAGRGDVSVELLEAVVPVREPAVAVTLAIGLLKGDQMDAVVRDATMLGASVIVPTRTAHVTVSSRAGRSGEPIDRWRRIAVASAKQCGRAVVPDIAAIRDVGELLAHAVPGDTWMCVEPRAAAGALDTGVLGAPRPAAALVLAGPEGGWAPEELALARARGVHAVHLGPRTLRAESAPLVALSALWTAWGW
jgi:16S rRNA (uracil1498-N3)-methyltransferase